MTDKQAFIRLLKELGIYNVYLNDREVARKGRTFPKFNTFITPHLKHHIMKSFCWSATKHQRMWMHIYSSCAGIYTCEKILWNDDMMNELKIIVKECIFKG